MPTYYDSFLRKYKDLLLNVTILEALYAYDCYRSNDEAECDKIMKYEQVK